MRISDWSSDVCSSDLYPRGSARIRGNLDIPGTRRQDAALCRSPFPRPSPIVGYRRKRERPAAAAVATAWDKKGRKAPRFRPPNSCADSLKRTRSEEHTSELQALMRISYAVFCLKKKTKTNN